MRHGDRCPFCETKVDLPWWRRQTGIVAGAIDLLAMIASLVSWRDGMGGANGQGSADEPTLREHQISCSGCGKILLIST